MLSVQYLLAPIDEASRIELPAISPIHRSISCRSRTELPQPAHRNHEKQCQYRDCRPFHTFPPDPSNRMVERRHAAAISTSAQSRSIDSLSGRCMPGGQSVSSSMKRPPASPYSGDSATRTVRSVGP